MAETHITLEPKNKPFDVTEVRKDFPILEQHMNGKPLVYLDNAATTQKPQVVIDTIRQYYTAENANIHRGVYALSEEATENYESTREVIKEYINAVSTKEIVFTKGTTDSINLVASSLGRKYLKEGDEVIISEMEHHSNIVPWQMLAETTGIKLKVIPINDDAELLMDEFKKLLSERTKLVSIVYVSNTLGTINPVKEIIELAHTAGAKVLVDGAQAIQHLEVDVQDLDCDFFAFSAHKVYGPTGTGVLYGKEALLDELPPYQGGGDMIKEVHFTGTTYNDLPYKFEAGTPNIAGVIGMKAALQYVHSIGLDNIASYEHELLQYATKQVKEIEGLRIIGTAREKTSSLSFLLGDIHPYDTGVLLDKMGVCVRTGHHCTQPVMDRFDIPGTCRASFSFYNTREEVNVLVEGLKKVQMMF